MLITGAGPIGALAALACAAIGAAKIFVSEPNANRRRHIEALGVPTAFSTRRPTMSCSHLRDADRGRRRGRFRHRMLGQRGGAQHLLEAVRNHGTVAQVGLHVKQGDVDPALWALKDITIEATWCYPVTIWPRVINMIASGRLPVEKLITGHIDATDVVEKGFKPLLDPGGREMKVMVTLES